MNNCQDLSYAYIEFYVGMAKMVAYWHVQALGFEVKGYLGPETGVSDRVSYLVTKGNINLVFTSAAKPSSSEILSFVNRHGNGAKRIAYNVSNVAEIFEDAVASGATPIMSPKVFSDDSGEIAEASIKWLDDMELLFFDNSNYQGLFRLGYEELVIEGFTPNFESGFTHIDHIAYGLDQNQTDYWCNYFQKTFGGDITPNQEPDELATRYSGLILKLLRTSSGVYSVFVEPVDKDSPSQVQEYLEAYDGSGIQHMALHTEDIFTTMECLLAQGVDFVKFPDAYYDRLLTQGVDAELVGRLQRYSLLYDEQGSTYLLQTFTKPLGDRPTLFYEIIQRTNGYQGFALNNIAELYDAVEEEKSKRSGAVKICD